MNKTLFRTLLSCAVLGPVLLSSCSENDDIWDPYYNWKNRNEAWYETIADSARTAISTAKSRYGEDWEKHCDWRMIKTYKKGADAAATLEDSICVHILTRGQGQYSAAFTDSVSLKELRTMKGYVSELGLYFEKSAGKGKSGVIQSIQFVSNEEAE